MWYLLRHAEDGSGVGSAIIAGLCFGFIILWDCLCVVFTKISESPQRQGEVVAP